VHHSDQTHNTHRWEIRAYGPADQAYLTEAGFPETPEPFLRYGAIPAKGYFILAKDLKLAGPVFSIDSDGIVDGNRVLSGTIASQREAFVLGFAFEEGGIVNTLEVDGQLVLGSPKRSFSGPQLVRLHGIGKTPVAFTLTLKGEELSGVTVFDQGKLPNVETARRLQQMRSSTAAPMHFGDYSLVTRTFDP
jgi:hypothetical protein